MSRSARWAAVALAVSVVAVAAVLLLAGGRSPSLDERVQQVAGELRCPTCDGESAAQSNAPMARSMRAEIRTQLKAGRSPDQVRAWFEERYGADVVLSPGGGLGWLLWVAPVAVAAGGAAFVLLKRRGRGGAGPATSSAAGGTGPVSLGAAPLALTAGIVATVAIAVPHVVSRGGDGGAADAATSPPSSAASSAVPPAVRRGQRLDAAGRYEEAVAAWSRAHRRYPSSAAVSTRLAFDLVRVGHAEQAPRLVRAAARRPGGQRPMALLVLGLAQRDLGRPQAESTLRTFLRVAPDHPAATQVRRLLGKA